MNAFVPKSNPKKIRISVRGVLEDNGKFLLLKRSAKDKHNAGVWEFPGGKLEKGQTLIKSLKREIKEEAGVSVSIINTPIVLFEIIKAGRYDGFSYMQIVYPAKKKGGKIKISNEHDAYGWFSKKKIEKMKTRPKTKAIIKQLYEAK